MPTPATGGEGAYQSNKAAAVAAVSTAAFTASPLGCILRGAGDSFRFDKAISLIARDHNCRKNVRNCVVLNGLLFMGSLLFYQLAIRPAVRFLLVYQWDSESAESTLSEHHLAFVESVLFQVFNAAWVLPMFFLAKLLNSLYYQRVANASFEAFRGETAVGYKEIKGKDFAGWVSVMLSDALYTLVMETLLIIETSLVGVLMPYGLVLSIVFNTWVTSLYCFEYAWLNSGWTLRRRIAYFERHWAYFFGFGLPFVMGTYFMPLLWSTALFSMLFPFFVIIATAASPVPSDYRKSFLSLVPDRVPICTPSRQITSTIMAALPKIKKDSNDSNST